MKKPKWTIAVVGVEAKQAALALAAQLTGRGMEPDEFRVIANPRGPADLTVRLLPKEPTTLVVFRDPIQPWAETLASTSAELVVRMMEES